MTYIAAVESIPRADGVTYIVRGPAAKRAQSSPWSIFIGAILLVLFPVIVVAILWDQGVVPALQAMNFMPWLWLQPVLLLAAAVLLGCLVVAVWMLAGLLFPEEHRLTLLPTGLVHETRSLRLVSYRYWPLQQLQGLEPRPLAQSGTSFLLLSTTTPIGTVGQRALWYHLSHGVATALCDELMQLREQYLQQSKHQGVQH